MGLEGQVIHMSNSLSNRPEPVLNEAKIAATVTGVLTGLLSIAVVLGFIQQVDTNALIDAVVAIVGGLVTVINFLAPIVRARRARALVTPLVNPRDDSGASLVAAR